MIENGLVQIGSRHTVAETLARLEAIVERKGLAVSACIDHSAAAARVGLTLRPTILFIFGNAQAGTPLMVASQTAGLDLPLKALVWQDENDNVWLSYTSPEHVGERHNIPESLLANIEGIRAICAWAAERDPATF
jgi:uncharacterized protein (DUF302 family)